MTYSREVLLKKFNDMIARKEPIIGGGAGNRSFRKMRRSWRYRSDCYL